MKMTSKDDMALPSTSLDPFEPEASAKAKSGTEFPLFGSLNKKSESKSADETNFMSFMETFGSPLCCHAVRLVPGQELRRSLLDFVSKKNLKAPFIMTCVGSARSAKLRLANATAEEPHYLLDLVGPLEIMSINGTFSSDGRCHLHASFSNEQGKVFGGHLIEMVVRTTAEVVIGECSAMVFERVYDSRTGFPELSIKER